jgi:hypothetical protein
LVWYYSVTHPRRLSHRSDLKLSLALYSCKNNLKCCRSQRTTNFTQTFSQLSTILGLISAFELLLLVSYVIDYF